MPAGSAPTDRAPARRRSRRCRRRPIDRDEIVPTPAPASRASADRARRSPRAATGTTCRPGAAAARRSARPRPPPPTRTEDRSRRRAAHRAHRTPRLRSESGALHAGPLCSRCAMATGARARRRKHPGVEMRTPRARTWRSRQSESPERRADRDGHAVDGHGETLPGSGVLQPIARNGGEAGRRSSPSANVS